MLGGGSASRKQHRSGWGLQDEEDIDFRQAQGIQLRRDQLQKWVHEPFFGDTVRDCLVRARLGTKYVLAKVQEAVVQEAGTAK